MIVPVPEILVRSQIKTVKPDTVAHRDAYTAPRLVEYHDYDPCDGREEPMAELSIAEAGRASRRDDERVLGVQIERQYAVGVFDIAILSAKQSDGLATSRWE